LKLSFRIAFWLAAIWVLITASAFVHETAHLRVRALLDVPIAGFDWKLCLLGVCRVTGGDDDIIIRLSGGSSASLAWVISYYATSRWHTTHALVLGFCAAALAGGELVAGLLEGLWFDLYSTSIGATLGIIAGVVAGLALHIQRVWGFDQAATTVRRWGIPL
jgi:hypothetical protein